MGEARRWSDGDPRGALESLRARLAARLPFVGGGRAAAQGADTAAAAAARAGSAVGALIEEGVSLERALEPVAAAERFVRAARVTKGSERHAEVVLRLSKQFSDMVFCWGHEQERAKLLAVRAAALSEAVMRERCDGKVSTTMVANAHLLHAVNIGRLALFCENRTKVELSVQTRDLAEAALRLGPSSDMLDLAHHTLGVWHREMAGLNLLVRMIVRVVYGASIGEGSSYKDAFHHFHTAAKLEPNRLIHRVEVAKTHYALGQREEALREVTAGLALPLDDVNAYHIRCDGEELLRALQTGTRPKYGGHPPPPFVARTPADAHDRLFEESGGFFL